MTLRCDANVLIYQVLDQVLADGFIAPGTPRAMFTAVDALRESKTSDGQLRRAESIAVEIHKLQLALQRSDLRVCGATTDKLKRLAAEWVDTRIRDTRRPVKIGA